MSHNTDPRFGWRWALVHSRLLDEDVVFVSEPEHVEAARAKHPGAVVYLWPELEEIVRCKDMPEFPRFLAAVHAAKVEFSGESAAAGAVVVATRLGATAEGSPVLVPGDEQPAPRPRQPPPAPPTPAPPTVHRSTRPRISPKRTARG